MLSGGGIAVLALCCAFIARDRPCAAAPRANTRGCRSSEQPPATSAGTLAHELAHRPEQTLALIKGRPFGAKGTVTKLHLVAVVSADSVHDGLHAVVHLLLRPGSGAEEGRPRGGGEGSEGLEQAHGQSSTGGNDVTGA